MLQQLSSKWRLFRTSAPGRRFRAWYRHRRRESVRGPFAPLLRRCIGAAVMAAGVIMLVTPGPGLLAIGLGAALLAGESLPMAYAMDRLELRLRRLLQAALMLWQGRPTLRLAVAAAGALLLVAPLYAGYLLFLG